MVTSARSGFADIMASPEARTKWGRGESCAASKEASKTNKQGNRRGITRYINNSLTKWALLLCLLAGVVFANWYLRTLGPRSKERVVRALAERFDADVELKSLEVSLLPHPSVVAEGLTIRHKRWQSPRPLISIRRFYARVGFVTALCRGDLVELVKLEGLEVYLPRRGKSSGTGFMTPHHGNDGSRSQNRLHFLVDTIVADGTLLQIEPKNPAKEPRRFDLVKLTLHSVSPGGALSFKAKLRNPIPPGQIETAGDFGPWQRDEPRATAVSGKYSFQNADLGKFKGIQGILSSVGEYNGVLERIGVNGTTDTPDFALKRKGEPVHLKTTFHSLVDGTNGDTILDPVDAEFGNSEFLCRGSISHLPGAEGKTISLSAETKHARMEDILKLVVGDSRPILTGAVDFKSDILIPQGPEPVFDKLQLAGRFAISEGEFASHKVEETLTTLSRRARGISKEEEAAKRNADGSVASGLIGGFKLRGGVASFSHCAFRVPGATVVMTGDYDLRSEAIDMKGIFRMDATLSDTQSGVKHLLLKPFDPLFEKDGAGFEVPISLTGTRKKPVFEALVLRHRITIH